MDRERILQEALRLLNEAFQKGESFINLQVNFEDHTIVAEAETKTIMIPTPNFESQAE